MEELGARLKRLRKAAGLTQAKLASAVALSQGTIGNIESGTRGYGQSLLGISRVLKVTPEYLNCETDSLAKSTAKSEGNAKTAGYGDQVIDPELAGKNPTIPTDMPFSNHNLSQTFRLLGNIIGALPAAKRVILAKHLDGLVKHPEASGYIAEQAVERLGIPDAITTNAQLNRWIAGNIDIGVETRPADLYK